MEQVCEQLDLNDVDIEYTESQFQNLMNYKMFTQFVRPILQKENAKASSSKIMMLTAAKWREFCEENPNLREEGEEEPAAEKSEKSEEEEEEDEPELEYQPKPSRSRRAAEKQEEPEDSDEDDAKKKKRSSTARSSKRGRKQKVVPTLKIKFGKKKDQSSDEEKVNCIILIASSAEFYQSLSFFF